MFALRCTLTWFVLCSLSARGDSAPHIVVLVAEREYETEKTLPAFAEKHLQEYRTTFVFESPEDRNALVGLDAIETADLLVVSVRRRTLPASQLDSIRNYVSSGRPVIGIRTASHAFCLRNQDPPEGRAAWPEFDRQVFGGNYTNHHGNALKATVRLVEHRTGRIASRLLEGLQQVDSFTAGGSLYQVSPLAKGATVVMTGRVEGSMPEPVAWTFSRADGGKSFYTSLGHVDDFQGDVFPVLLRNAVAWAVTD